MQAKLIFLIPNLISIVLAVGLGVFAIRRRSVNGAKIFAVLTFSQAIGLLANILELASTDIVGKTFWDSFQWTTVSVASIAYFIFALKYVKRIKGSSKNYWYYLMIYPVIFQILDFASSFHTLTRINSQLIEREPFSFLLYDFTPLSYLLSIGIVLLPIAAIGILIRYLFSRKNNNKWQTLVLILGALIPTLGVVTIILFPDSVYRDVSPFTYALSSVFFAIGLFRFRLLDILPIAREMVVENLPEAVLVLDVDGRIIDMNQATEKLLGTTKEETLGKHIIQAFQIWSEITQRYIDLTQALAEFPIELGGEKRMMQLEIAPIHNKREKLTGRVVLIRDITEARAVEEAMKEANRLSEEARVAAEQADQMKSQFLAGMSHELRTPLNAILTFSELMGKEVFGPVTEEQKDYLDKTLQSGQHLLELINDILDITKIQAGMMSLFVEEDFDVTTELKTVVDMVEQMLRDKSVALTTTIAPDFPLLVCDKRRIRQILLNLLSNAAKFTEEGTISLNASFEDEEVLFTISDSGEGIEPDKLENVFEPFVQTESGMQMAASTGLGLPISRELAEAHGGKLWVESTFGEGSTFYVTIPRTLKPN